MYRQNITRRSPGVWGIIRSQDYNGYLQWRDAQGIGDARDNSVNLTGLNVPCWFRAVYLNGQVTVFYAFDDLAVSADEVVWQFEETHPLNTEGVDFINGGLCVTSHDNAQLVNAQFSNVNMLATAAPKMANAALSETEEGDVELTWDLAGEGEFDSIRIECQVLPYDVGWVEIADLTGDATSYLDTTEGLIKGQYRIVVTFDAPESLGAVSNIVTLDYLTSNLEGNYFSALLADAPIAYWRFSEPAGLTIAFNFGTLDSAVNGTYNGAIVLEESGLLQSEDNTAALFNGIDSWVQIPNNGQINTSGPFHTISIEFWFQVNEVTADAAVIYEHGGATRGISIYVMQEGDTPQLYMMAWNRAEEQWGTAALPLYVITEIEIGVPYHAVMVFDASANDVFGDFDGRITGYLDGEIFDEVIGADQLYNHSGDIRIGHPSETVVHSGNKTFFNSIIDEFSFYAYLLDDPNDDGDMDDSIVGAHYQVGVASEGINRFIGDANCDDGVNIADAVAVLSYLFAGGDLKTPGGVTIETAGCAAYDPAGISADVLPCDTPCQ